MKRCAYSVKEPVTGMSVAISPNDCLAHQPWLYRDLARTYMTKKTMIPTKEKLINTPAGPPLLRALPEPTSKPGPIIPGLTLGVHSLGCQSETYLQLRSYVNVSTADVVSMALQTHRFGLLPHQSPRNEIDSPPRPKPEFPLQTGLHPCLILPPLAAACSLSDYLVLLKELARGQSDEIGRARFCRRDLTASLHY
jgi:hypothetical protein